MTAYYNEIDPFAAAWLRELIKAGRIAPGDVDERSIVDVRPTDLRGYTQCHFFAGIGVWSYALRRAGWPDDRPIWTGSCPCQPFSAAGAGAGFADERHLWPHFHWLVDQCRPPVVLGEQVASKDGLAWLDLVQADLEGSGYASAAVDTCSAGVGAPHIRQRLYWLAHAAHELDDGAGRGRARGRFEYSDGCATGGLDDDDDTGLEGQRGRHKAESGRQRQVRPVAETGQSGGVGDAERVGARRDAGTSFGAQGGSAARPVSDNVGSPSSACGPGPTNGFWRDADWLFCRDGKWRPVEPRSQSVVDGVATSLGRVCDDRVRELEFEIVEWAIGHQIDPGKAVYDLRRSLSAEPQREWAIGGLPALHETPFLLAFLCQLAEQGWSFAERLSGESEENAKARMRVLRDVGAAACAPRERGLDGQPPGECADPMRVLSSILARHASEAWANAYATYAPIGFPLERNAKARVGRLRGYGNAINAVQAQVFIEAVIETIDDRPDDAVRLTILFD